MSQTTLVGVALVDMLAAAKEASLALATATTDQKNLALHAIARRLGEAAPRILQANELDLANGRESGLADAVLQIAALTDPVGEAVRGSSLPNGMKITQVRVPFGVVGAIYEARPNVTIDIAALAIKSGNAAVLRGGSAAIETNRVLVELLQNALESAGLPREAAQTID